MLWHNVLRVIPRKVNALIILCVDWRRHVMVMLSPLQHWSDAAVRRWAWARLARLIYRVVNCYVWVFDNWHHLTAWHEECSVSAVHHRLSMLHEHNVSCICILFPHIFLHRGFCCDCAMCQYGEGKIMLSSKKSPEIIITLIPHRLLLLYLSSIIKYAQKYLWHLRRFIHNLHRS